jgi:catechol-2,3-dioxygenase
MSELAIQGIYEVAIRVKDLVKSEAFYCDALGLTVGLRDGSRRWLFLRAGQTSGMVVLQEDKSNWPVQHFAFTIMEKDLDGACKRLAEKGIDFEGPVLHEWMPAKSVYFSDPDDNDLELCAPLLVSREIGDAE